MADLKDLKNIIDEKLRDVKMTEEQKESVRCVTAWKGRAARRPYGRTVAAVAAMLAVALIISVAIPNLGDRTPVATTAGTAASTTAGTTAALTTQQVIRVAESLEVEAVEEDGGSVKAGSGFRIRSNVAVSLSQLAALITMSPDIAFSLTKSGEREFLLKPDSPLAQNTLVNISVAVEDELLRTWAFQTGSELSVTSTLPGDGTYGMPLNTGIEVTFSGTFTDAESHFDISPAVKGHFESHDNILVFVPDEDLQPDTIYRVTISAGVSGETGDRLAEDYSFSFRTPGDYNDRLYLLDSFTESYLSTDTVVISVNATEGYDERMFTVELYELESAEAYLALAAEHESAVHPEIGYSHDVMLDTRGYERVMSFDTRLYRQETGWWQAPHIIFPETPDEGWYLADITVEGSQRRLQKLIQVSDLSVFTQSVNGEALIWVNDAASGKAVQGAQITLGYEGQSVSCVSDAEGVARCTLDAEAALIMISDEGKDYNRCIRLADAQEATLADQYYSLLYTDRVAYLPSDTVHFWGKLMPKSGDTAIPETLDVYFDTLEGARLMTVDVSADGVFKGAIEFANRSSGYFRLLVASFGEEVQSAWISVSDYTKPTYLLSMEAEKDFYGPGEAITVHVTGTFYDGTPAQGLAVAMHHDQAVDGSWGASDLTLDAQGKLTYTFTPAHSARSWRPASCYVSCETASAEDVWVSAGAWVQVFRGDRVVEIENRAGDAIQIDVNAHELLMERYDPDMDYDDLAEALSGEPADIRGTLSVIEYGYVSRETGSYYDHIRKQNIITYDYDYVQTEVYNKHFTTTNGKWLSPVVEIDTDSSMGYRVVLYYTDGGGRELKEELGIVRSRDLGYSERCYFHTNDETYLQLDESCTLTLARDGEALTDGRMLVSVTQDTFLRHTVGQAGDYTLTFTQADVPGVYVNGVYFDGKHVYEVSSIYLGYETEEQALDISIRTDRETYAPGDTVEVTVEVMDEERRAVSADVVLSVVDNAAFDVMEHDFRPLPMLYPSYRIVRPVTSSSYRDHTIPDAGGAEGGGGDGSESLREDFEDTAAFLTAQTDPQGRATLRFTLPDNLTSWRFSVVAMCDDAAFPQAGIASRDVPATLPFFLNAVTNDRYLSRDDVSVSLRAAGAELDMQENVEYTVEVSGNGENRKLTTRGKAGDFTFVNLGSLPEGVYSLTMRASCGEYADGVKKTIEVVESRHELLRFAHGDLSEGISVDSLRYPVTIELYDLAQEPILRALSRAQTSTSRLDGVMAELVRQQLYGGQANTNVLSTFQYYNGGMRLFRYGEAEVEVTAQAAAACPDWFDAGSMKRYFRMVLEKEDSTSAEVTAAYMGLAVWKEPVLREVRLLLEEETELTMLDKLNLVTALALLGDDDGAALWLADHEQEVRTLRNENERFTGLCRLLTLATLRGDTAKADALLDQVLQTPNAYVSPAFALCTYLSRLPAPESSAAVVSCSVDGERRELRFDQSWIQTLRLSGSELAVADLRVEKGQVGYRVTYTDTLTESNVLPGMTVSQSYDTTAPAVGELVKLTLTVSGEQVEDGILSVVIPSGMRYVGTVRDSATRYCYLIQAEDGRLTVRMENQESHSISFWVRCVLAGEYYAEAPVYAPSGSSEIATGVGTAIVIHE